jgi:integrase
VLHQRAACGTEAALIKLLQETPTSDPIWAVSALCLYTGLRLEEAWQLRREHCDGATLRVGDARSDAGVRKVPVHPVILPIVRSPVASVYGAS